MKLEVVVEIEGTEAPPDWVDKTLKIVKREMNLTFGSRAVVTSHTLVEIDPNPAPITFAYKDAFPLKAVPRDPFCTGESGPCTTAGHIH